MRRILFCCCLSFADINHKPWSQHYPIISTLLLYSFFSNLLNKSKWLYPAIFRQQLHKHQHLTLKIKYRKKCNFVSNQFSSRILSPTCPMFQIKSFLMILACHSDLLFYSHSFTFLNLIPDLAQNCFIPCFLILYQIFCKRNDLSYYGRMLNRD